MVLTGWFPVERKLMIEMVKKCGGKITGIINDETQLLVVGQRPGNKLFDANEFGIPMLFYTELSLLLGITNRSSSLEL